MRYLFIALLLIPLLSCEKREQITFQEAKQCAQACQEIGKGYMGGHRDQEGHLMCQCWYW